VAGVMIGIDPHKGSHTAVALDTQEKLLGQLRVRASSRQVGGLLEWAVHWPDRTWAVEGARGLGHLLAQQLIAAGERVLDVPPKLAARIRLLDSSQINKNDDNDARSVAVAAQRGHDLPELSVEDHSMMLRVWARRYHDLGRLRTQAVCRLHALLRELIPGGVRKELRARQAIKVLDGIAADSPVMQAKLELARDLVADLERIDAQRREVKRRTARAVAAAHTTITDVYGVGPIIAATVLGYVRDIRRFPTRDRFASYNGTAPHRGLLRRPEDLPALPARQPATQSRHPHRCDLPDPPPRHRRARLLRAQDRRRDGRQSRAPGAEAKDQRFLL
jgi:transposase